MQVWISVDQQLLEISNIVETVHETYDIVETQVKLNKVEYLVES